MKMAHSRNVFENPLVSHGIELKGFTSQNYNEGEYHSIIDDVNDSVTKVDTVSTQQGNAKDVKVKLTENVTSSITPCDSAIQGKNGNRKSNVKLVIILILVMIAIAAAGSTVSTLLFKKVTPVMCLTLLYRRLTCNLP